MAKVSDRKEKPKRPAGRLTLYLLGGFVLVCFIGALFIGDLAKFQDTGFVKEGQVALRSVDDAQQLDQVLKQYPSNRILKLVALARRDADDADEAARKLLNDLEPAGLMKPADLSAASRDGLEGLRRDLKAAQAKAASFSTRLAAALKTKRDEVERDARLLSVDSAVIAAFMTIIDAQHADATARATKGLAARTDYYAAYDKCAAVLLSQSGSYKITNGQLIFQLQQTANSYNDAGKAMAAAAKRMTDLDSEQAGLRQSQFMRWKAFVER